MIDDDFADSIVVVLADLFERNPKKEGWSGSLPDDVGAALRLEARRELARPLKPLLDARKAAFCFPDPPLRYPATEEEFRSLKEDGATLVIQGLEQRNHDLNRICGGLSQSLDHIVTCSLYMSPRDALSLGPHRDEWDVLATQTEGTKVFSVETPGGHRHFRLEPGDWLRLDPDDVHSAVADQQSIHLSLGRHRKHAVRITD